MTLLNSYILTYTNEFLSLNIWCIQVSAYQNIYKKILKGNFSILNHHYLNS